jgi:hypothetical protein
MNKQKRMATELEDIVKQRIGARDFKIAIHHDPQAAWRATIYGRQQAEVRRRTIAVELCQHYELND